MVKKISQIGSDLTELLPSFRVQLVSQREGRVEWPKANGNPPWKGACNVRPGGVARSWGKHPLECVYDLVPVLTPNV